MKVAEQNRRDLASALIAAVSDQPSFCCLDVASLGFSLGSLKLGCSLVFLFLCWEWKISGTTEPLKLQSSHLKLNVELHIKQTGLFGSLFPMSFVADSVVPFHEVLWPLLTTTWPGWMESGLIHAR